jgi:hypothetical protein
MEISVIRKLPFFFILSRPRSGTTLLRTLLDAHPNISIPPEHVNLIHLYFKYRFKKGRWNKDQVDSLYSDFSSHPGVKTFWKYDETFLREQLYQCASDNGSFADLIKIIYASYQSFNSKKDISILGDKSPVNSLYSPILSRIFPDARFIHLVRDYRGNLASMIKYETMSPGITTIVMHWRNSVDQIEKMAKANPSRFLTLKYEDMVTYPEKFMPVICDFLNVPYVEQILDFDSRREVVKKAYDKEFILNIHPNLNKQISTDSITKWREKLNNSEIKSADYLAGRTGDKFDYTKIYKKFAFAFRFLTFLKITAFYQRELQRHIFDHLPYAWKIKIRNRKFILSREIINLSKRFFGKK